MNPGVHSIGIHILKYTDTDSFPDGISENPVDQYTVISLEILATPLNHKSRKVSSQALWIILTNPLRFLNNYICT